VVGSFACRITLKAIIREARAAFERGDIEGYLVPRTSKFSFNAAEQLDICVRAET
jgi:hypothetical protein